MLKHPDPHSSAKAVIAFLIVVIAFSMLFIFEMSKDNIIQSDNIHSFIFLAFLGSLLLLTLLYLVNKPYEKVAKSRSRKRK